MSKQIRVLHLQTSDFANMLYQIHKQYDKIAFILLKLTVICIQYPFLLLTLHGGPSINKSGSCVTRGIFYMIQTI